MKLNSVIIEGIVRDIDNETFNLYFGNEMKVPVVINNFLKKLIENGEDKTVRIVGKISEDSFGVAIKAKHIEIVRIPEN